jgi:hypothetical protein
MNDTKKARLVLFTHVGACADTVLPAAAVRHEALEVSTRGGD